MYKDYFLITSIFLVIYSVNGMVFSGGLVSRLGLLLQKSVRYNHHKQNYERCIFEGIIPARLVIISTKKQHSNQYRVISTNNGTQFYTTRKKGW